MGRQAGREGQGHGQLLHHRQVLLLQQLKLPLLQLLDLLHLLKLFHLLLLLLLLSLLLLLLSLLEGMDKLRVGVKWLKNSSNSPEMVKCKLSITHNQSTWLLYLGSVSSREGLMWFDLVSHTQLLAQILRRKKFCCKKSKLREHLYLASRWLG